MMEEEINIREIVLTLWRGKVMIATIFALAVFIAVIYSFTVTPVYQVTGEIALGNYDDKTFTTQASAKEILLSDEILLAVGEQLNLPKDDLVLLQKKLKVDPVKESNIIKITLLTTNKTEGKEFIEKMIQIFNERAALVYNKQKDLLAKNIENSIVRLGTLEKDIDQTRKLLTSLDSTPGLSSVEKDLRTSNILDYLQSEENTRISISDSVFKMQKELDALKNVEVIISPREPEKPMYPYKSLNVLIAGILGLLIGIFCALLFDYFKKNPFNMQ